MENPMKAVAYAVVFAVIIVTVLVTRSCSRPPECVQWLEGRVDSTTTIRVCVRRDGEP